MMKMIKSLWATLGVIFLLLILPEWYLIDRFINLFRKNKRSFLDFDDIL